MQKDIYVYTIKIEEAIRGFTEWADKRPRTQAALDERRKLAERQILHYQNRQKQLLESTIRPLELLKPR